MRNIDKLVMHKHDAIYNIVDFLTSCTKCPHYDECEAHDTLGCNIEFTKWLNEEAKEEEE